VRPLVNAAGDFFEGLTTEEAEVRASISGNRPTFPLATAAAVTNALNQGAYLGGAAYSWKCSGISAQQATEVVNDIEINYWQVSVELVYRQSGWPLLLPHVGWHYLDGSEKSCPTSRTTKATTLLPHSRSRSQATARFCIPVPVECRTS
jgi:hypothetical protein